MTDSDLPAGLDRLFVHTGDPIRLVIACIDDNVRGIALVVDSGRRLLGTVTDGDIRRAILAGLSLDAPAQTLLDRKAGSPYPQPVTAPVAASRDDLLDLMQQRHVRQVPLLDDQGRVQGLVTLDELVPAQSLPVQAVIMAGGAGVRLRPLTDQTPKPMLPVGDRPLMEHTLARLRQSGIRQVSVTTHYLGERIAEHFGDGRAFGVDISYVPEEVPLGTAGALGLVRTSDQPLLVINGDILTRVDFRALLAFHRDHQADLTVAVRQYDVQVPYGAVECDGPRVVAIAEKPRLRFLVNAGVYLLEQDVIQFIAPGEHLDMPELIQKLLDADRIVVSFPILEYWLDIGQHASYQQAQEDVVAMQKEGRWTS